MPLRNTVDLVLDAAFDRTSGSAPNILNNYSKNKRRQELRTKTVSLCTERRTKQSNEPQDVTRKALAEMSANTNEME